MVITFTIDYCVLRMVKMKVMTVMVFTNLEPGSCDLDRLTGFAILSLRKPPVPLTLEADLASPVPVPILTIDTPSSTKVSNRLLLLLLLLLLGLVGLALSWRFVG